MLRSIALLALLVPASLSAHDFWIEPSTFRPAPGSTVTASLRVGQNFLGDPVPRSAQLIERFVVRDGAGERTIGGFERQDPAGWFRIESPGLAVIAYRSRQSRVELAPDKFADYLKQEGLERILPLRDATRPSRELFSRCAKALLFTGSGSGAKFDEPLGLRLELIPETNPYGTAAAQRMRLLFEGKPLEGALVIALNQDGTSLRARSDKSGRVTFTLGKGVWLIKAVHMIKALPDADADWESLWASLTFER